MDRLLTYLMTGIRPEAISITPVVQAYRRRDQYEAVDCRARHQIGILAQAAEGFDIAPNEELELMQDNRTRVCQTVCCSTDIDTPIENYALGHTVAQGDTATDMVTSMAASYRGLPFLHVEAGLNKGDLQTIFSEEFSSRLVGTYEVAIVSAHAELLTYEVNYTCCQSVENRHGDGDMAQRIVEPIDSRDWQSPGSEVVPQVA
ncbi:MAG: UDP-N-acetylglucosamine 2-epimerase [Planctomycetota bacterium]